MTTNNPTLILKKPASVVLWCVVWCGVGSIVCDAARYGGGGIRTFGAPSIGLAGVSFLYRACPSGSEAGNNKQQNKDTIESLFTDHHGHQHQLVCHLGSLLPGRERKQVKEQESLQVRDHQDRGGGGNDWRWWRWR